VRSGNEKTNDRDNLLEETVLAGENGGTASLEGGGDVAVDVGDDRAIRLLADDSSQECKKQEVTVS